MDGRISNKFLVVTANIGSLFEEHGRELQRNWMKSFHTLVNKHQPAFIALHLQEIGGKADYQNEDSVATYFQELREPDVFNEYTCTCSYVDQECSDNATYTALGCCYFVHKSLQTVQQWNFISNSFDPITRIHQFSGISDNVGTVRKFKFPLDCYSKSQKRLPRKGFTWTRWKIQERVIDFLNIHLTHDANNVYCAMKSPTKYSKHRRRAFQFILQRLADSEAQHQILFGDFNVRPDTKALVEHLMAGNERLMQEDDEGQPTSLVYKKKETTNLTCLGIRKYVRAKKKKKDILKIENRFFELKNYEAFNEDNVPNIISFDRELEWLKQDHHYRELPISFQPTYPHKEDPEDKGTTFLNVRCPSWCDRVLVDSKLFEEIDKTSSSTIYDSFGKDICLGDHKPVFMSFDLP